MAEDTFPHPRDPSTIQTAAELRNVSGPKAVKNLKASKRERRVLRELALKMAGLAARPEEAEKAALWTRHNDLQETQPLVFCDPENGWNEIIPPDQLECHHPQLRVWEMTLRKELFWGIEMRDHRVIEPYFNVPYLYRDTGWGLSDEKIGGHNGGSYIWDPPIKNYDRDFPRLKTPRYIIDSEATSRLKEMAEEIFVDVLTVRLRGSWWWSLGLTQDFIWLRGLENLMMDMCDHPHWVHRLMEFLSRGTLAKLDYLETNGLLSLNTEGTYVGSGGFGWTTQLPEPGFRPEKVRTRDMWGFCESQETVGVSPQMFSEFVFPYQKPILERFGLNCYGCCEPLDSRWETVRQAPRLRRVSVSPWSHAEKMAEYLGNRYIFSLKPSPTPLSRPQMDEQLVRRELRKAIRATRSCRLEIIMKDNHTLGGNPSNVTRWCRIAREESEGS
jgi:hypothetical protein